MSKNVKTALVIFVILLALAIVLYLLRKRLGITGNGNDTAPPTVDGTTMAGDDITGNENKYMQYEGRMVRTPSSCCYYIKDGKIWSVKNWMAVIREFGDPPQIAMLTEDVWNELPYAGANNYQSWDSIVTKGR